MVKNASRPIICTVVVLQTTAGWRKAPALAQRVCTQGVASLRSISLKNTMNTKGLEWFGPPERNTLHPVWWFVFPLVLFDVLEGSLPALI